MRQGKTFKSLLSRGGWGKTPPLRKIVSREQNIMTFEKHLWSSTTPALMLQNH